MTEIEALLESIQRNRLLRSPMFDKIDAEAILSSRDDPDFEGKWLQLFEEVKGTSITNEQAATIEQIREAAYKVVFNSTSNPDLSGYVSDDFEIIAKGAASGLNNQFLNGLLKSYLDAEVPGGHHLNSQEPINAMITRLRESL